ncbi:hypothetical protein HA402_005115 [Bradysia odoriphaga]|nr:hypothetical protein HA402_005115 [Bradysia odoriphaga]
MTQHACHLDLTNFRFNIFTPAETELLSVAKIENDHLVDAAGFPIPGGLYDPAMGPYDYDSGSCQTCGNSFVDCVGHMGHIKLCKPVYNRIFGRAVYSIMRMSCLHCFKLQLPDVEIEILRLQLRLTELGYIRESQELEIMKASLMMSSEERENKVAEYEALIEKNQPNLDCRTKTTEEQRMSLVNPVILSRPKSKNCIHCRQLLSTFKYTQNRLIRSVLKAELQQTLGVEAARAADVPVLPEECRDYLRKIYKQNPELLNLLFPSLKAHNKLKHPVDICFTDIIPVTPINTRPVNLTNLVPHHEQTQMYINIILENSTLKLIMDQADKFAAENILNEKMLKAWQKLQSCVDQLWDEKMGFERGFKGLKQLIEKKEGIIRMHMLGKRVNFAGRTVITPDPYINVDEIGIPEVFAKQLTYPVPVTEWNAEELRKYVINGPNVHPGAKFIEEGTSNKIIPGHSKAVRESMAKTLLVSNGPKVVHRHLLNGDILLLNRQPSLHRPSIMAHKVKVMKHEKTLRLHYSNCKSYNADFDGDEMNCHCPQNELARSEAYNLVNVANNFLVPKDGTPLGGLIQDHVVAGVKMTLRGRFFNREDYHQLVFVALSHIKRDLELLTPAIIKPVALWSGKQILSTIIKNISPKNKGINLKSTIKITSRMWEKTEPREMLAGGTRLRDNEMTETEVIIRGGDIVAGVFDKTHFGATPHGLIHCMYESRTP